MSAFRMAVGDPVTHAHVSAEDVHKSQAAVLNVLAKLRRRHEDDTPGDLILILVPPHKAAHARELIDKVLQLGPDPKP